MIKPSKYLGEAILYLLMISVALPLAVCSFQHNHFDLMYANGAGALIMLILFIRSVVDFVTSLKSNRKGRRFVGKKQCKKGQRV